MNNILVTKKWPQYLDVGGVDFSQEDLLRLQTAQFAQQFLQPRVFLIHVQPQAVAHRRGTVQFNDCKHSRGQRIEDLLLKHASESLTSSDLTSDLKVHRAVHGQGKGQEVEGVEASADVSAGLTLHLGFELAVEQVHHDGAVPAQVVLPRLLGQTHRGVITQH